MDYTMVSTQPPDNHQDGLGAGECRVAGPTGNYRVFPPTLDSYHFSRHIVQAALLGLVKFSEVLIGPVKLSYLV